MLGLQAFKARARHVLGLPAFKSCIAMPMKAMKAMKVLPKLKVKKTKDKKGDKADDVKKKIIKVEPDADAAGDNVADTKAKQSILKVAAGNYDKAVVVVVVVVRLALVVVEEEVVVTLGGIVTVRVRDRRIIVGATGQVEGGGVGC